MAVEMLPMLEAEAKAKEYERKTTCQKIEKSSATPVHSAAQAAAATGTNREYVSQATAVRGVARGNGEAGRH